MDKERFFLKTVIHIQVSFTKITFKVMVFTNGKTDNNMKVSGLNHKCMVREHINFQTELNLKDFITKEIGMARESFISKIKIFTKATGSWE